MYSKSKFILALVSALVVLGQEAPQAAAGVDQSSKGVADPFPSVFGDMFAGISGDAPTEATNQETAPVSDKKEDQVSSEQSVLTDQAQDGGKSEQTNNFASNEQVNTEGTAGQGNSGDKAEQSPIDQENKSTTETSSDDNKPSETKQTDSNEVNQSNAGKPASNSNENKGSPQSETKANNSVISQSGIFAKIPSNSSSNSSSGLNSTNSSNSSSSRSVRSVSLTDSDSSHAASLIPISMISISLSLSAFIL